MVQFKKWQLFLVILFSFFAIIFSLPNFLSKETLKKVPSFLPSEQVVLGLDLQGGSYLLIEVDTESVVLENFESFSDRLRLSLRKNKIPYTKFNETELRVDLPNGARITLLGSDSPDGLRGIYLDGCVIDEYANVTDKLFPEIIRPALSDRKGYCIFIGTPAGMNNNFYELYQHAQGADDWFDYKAKASETQIVDEEELSKAKEVMGEKKYLQEFECDWVANIEGAIYSDALTKMENSKQITRVPYDPSLPVSTSMDLGVADHTAIIFFQQLGRAINIIDYYNKAGIS